MTDAPYFGKVFLARLSSSVRPPRAELVCFDLNHVKINNNNTENSGFNDFIQFSNKGLAQEPKATSWQ